MRSRSISARASVSRADADLRALIVEAMASKAEADKAAAGLDPQ
jgi:hypothetical protein